MPASNVEQAFLASQPTSDKDDMQSRDADEYSRTRKGGALQRWSSSWQAPVTMIGLLLIGCAMAVIHHLFYSSLHDSKTPDNYSQQRNIAYGTAFAFATKACLIAAVGSAYTQHMWSDFRKKFIKISTIDSTFTATSSIVSLLDPRFLWSCKTGALIAMLAWLLPLSAIVTPSTLSVRPFVNTTTTDLLVPNVNFSMFEDFREGDTVKKSLSRLAKLVTSGVQIPPIDIFITNSTYDLEVVGPSLQCDTPPPDVVENIDAVFEGTSEPVEGLNSTTEYPSVYVAFTPFAPWAYNQPIWPLEDLGEIKRNSSDWTTFIDFCVKNWRPACSLIGPTRRGIPTGSLGGYGKTISTANALWLRFDQERLLCSVQKTRYKLVFDAHHPLTALRSYTSENEGHFESDSPENAGFITAVQPLLDLLTGATYFNPSWCFTSSMQMTKCTSFLPYVISQTSVHETALSALISGKAQDIRNRTLDAIKGMGIQAPKDPIPSLDPLDIPLTRNLSLGEIIEEMSRNMTLSYFTDSRYLSFNGTTAAVTVTHPVNIYSYNWRNLVLAYAIAVGTSMLAVTLGLYVFVKNGHRNGTRDFSSILSTTITNRHLAESVEKTSLLDSGSTLASMVASSEVLQLRLKFGSLLDEPRSNAEAAEETDSAESRRIEAFGLPGQVI